MATSTLLLNHKSACVSSCLKPPKCSHHSYDKNPNHPAGPQCLISWSDACLAQIRHYSSRRPMGHSVESQLYWVSPVMEGTMCLPGRRKVGVSPSYPQQFRWHHYLGVGEMPNPQAWNHYLTQQLTRGSLHSARGVEVGPRPWDPYHPEAANFTECWNGLLKAEANQPLGDNYLAKLGCHLTGCSMYTESETYHVALCPLKEEYLSPGTNRRKQQQSHFLSLPVTRWELLLPVPTALGFAGLASGPQTG